MRNILRETDDKEFYVDKIKSIENEILNLRDRFDTVNKYNIAKEIVEIEDFIDIREFSMNHYFDAFIKILLNTSRLILVKELELYIYDKEVQNF